MVAASLVPQKQLPYVDVFGLVPMLVRMVSDPADGVVRNPPNVLLTGPAGGGKTLLSLVLAQTLGVPVLSLDCSEETRERHIKGGFVAKDGSTPYVLGTVANAIMAANEHGLAVLVLEEMNTLSSQMQKLLNPVLDFRRKLEVPEISMRFDVQDGASLVVVGTANPTDYGGTYDINEDLKSRFVEVEVGYPSPQAEKAILRTMAPPGVEFTQATFDYLVNIARETRQGSTHYMLSTRDLVQAMTLIPRVGWSTVMFLLGQKFSGQDRTLFLSRVTDITGEVIPSHLPSTIT